MMLQLRSTLFNAVFYLNLIAQMVIWTPLFFLLPRKKAWFVPKFWARSSLWLHRVLAGAGAEISGQENLPAGSFILAPKHQSFWDVIAFYPYLRDPLFILKRELTWIPFFGWYIRKMRMVPVNRGDRAGAMRAVTAGARREMQDDRQLIIYPEGTRRAPGDAPLYKYGIVELYSQLGLPVVPVAHVAGLYWPRRMFLRYPGTIKARFLPAIPAGLPRDVFMARLIRETEAAADALLLEAAHSKYPPPMPQTAARRLAELGFTLPAPPSAARPRRPARQP